MKRREFLSKLGVRMITLVHGTITQSGDNAIDRDMRRYSSSDPNGGGLTDFGRQVVARMNRLGMVIDVAHASTQTLIDVASCTRAPIIDSHTSPMPPSITTRDAGGRLRLYDEMASIVETGGVVCTWPLAYDSSEFERLTFTDWIEEIKVFKAHFGMRQIGLGTDGGGGCLTRSKDGRTSAISATTSTPVSGVMAKTIRSIPGIT